MAEQGEPEDARDVDYDDVVDGWEFPDDHYYGEPREVAPWTRPGFDKAVKKHILTRDLGGNCPICRKPLSLGQTYTTKKMKTKIDTLDIDHYSPDWIVRLRGLKDHFNLNPDSHANIRRAVRESYNDYDKTAALQPGRLRLTHSPCNRGRSKS